MFMFNKYMNEPNSPLTQLMRGSEILSALDGPEFEKIRSFARKRVLSKNEVVCYQGDHCKFVLFIEKGSLRSVVTAVNGREHVIYTWGQKEEFWSHSIFDEESMPSTLQAAERNTVVYQWPGELMYEAILENKAATRALIKRQTQLIRKRRDRIYNLAFNPVASRLAKLILERSEGSGTTTMQRDLTLEDMAAMVATSPEVVCRVMYQFQDEGLLTINRATITLKDLDNLEKMVLKDQ